MVVSNTTVSNKDDFIKVISNDKKENWFQVISFEYIDLLIKLQFENTRICFLQTPDLKFDIGGLCDI